MSKLTIPEVGPNYIVVIGDVHGFTGTYQKFINRLPAGQRTIQIGDMGIGFEGVGLHRMPDSHTWFRGNHDNPKKCRTHPNYRGDYGYDETTGIFHLAGAWSIDRAYRTEGVTWWPDEELDYVELAKAVELYTKVKPRIVLSHDAPAKAVETLLYDLVGPYFMAKQKGANSRTSQALQIMLDTHQPDEWVFGHFHVDKSFHTPGYDTKFRCVGGMMQAGEPPHAYMLKVN